MLYGSSPLPEFQNKLRAVMTLKTRVTLVRDFGSGRGVSYGRTFITPRPMRIATLASATRTATSDTCQTPAPKCSSAGGAARCWAV